MTVELQAVAVGADEVDPVVLEKARQAYLAARDRLTAAQGACERAQATKHQAEVEYANARRCVDNLAAKVSQRVRGRHRI